MKKQKTLEEAAEGYAEVNKFISDRPFEFKRDKSAFISGAFWQKERMYSEEDMKSFADWCRNGLLNTEYSVDRLNQHLEQWKQFKKK